MAGAESERPFEQWCASHGVMAIRISKGTVTVLTSRPAIAPAGSAPRAYDRPLPKVTGRLHDGYGKSAVVTRRIQ